MAANKPDDNQQAEAAANKPADKPVVVMFLKSWGLYNKGEKAGFSAEKAAWLIEKKIAAKA